MLAALVLSATVAAPPDAPPPVMIRPLPAGVIPAHCRPDGPRMAVQRGTTAPRKLGELPPGFGIRLVNKTVDGCPVSVLLQRGPDGKPLERLMGAPGRLTPAHSDQAGAQRQR